MTDDERPEVRASTAQSWIRLASAVVLLNASVTFRNIWPTPAFWWTGDLSVELAGFLLALSFLSRRLSRTTLSWLAAVWLLLVVGRYIDVTAPALLGREVNLFWDVRYVLDVAAMFATAASRWVLALATLAAVSTAWLLYRSIRWALDRIAAGLTRSAERRALRSIGGVALVLFTVQWAAAMWAPSLMERPGLRFARPITGATARQARLLTEAVAPRRTPRLAPPALSSDLSLVASADVLLVFMESYGAVTWQRPAFVQRLTASRADLTAAIRASGKEIVSAYVESPTFGGSSWFAHISLLSGIEVKDPNDNALLMTERRDTLITTFARRGYRTVAVMPGLWQPWPEGSFYGFREIYGGERLAYQGPQFGWWAIPDQFTLARLSALELDAHNRAPVFAFFPTVSTHTPFAPAPLYQPDWTRVLTAQPFDEADVIRRFDDQPDWTNLSPSYADAVAYAHAALGGFFEQRAARDFVMILLGDHQPPALVTGEGASWDVPVHVIASRPDVLERLRARGFRPGLEPRGQPIGRMHELLPVLLDSFGDRQPTTDTRLTP